MHLQNQQKVRRISMLNAMKWRGEEEEEESLWDGRFPQVHDIKVKHIGKSARWESVKGILTRHRDRGHRQRRVWVSFSGRVPTTEELALEWPQGKQTVTQRRLRDDEEDQLSSGIGPLKGPGDLTVTEKMGVDGRRFWREVIKVGDLNDEEIDKDWKEMMREEGFDDEIARLMEKE